MSVRYPRYPAYKDSRVEWLGEVPEHWNIIPVHLVASVVNGFPFKAELFSHEGKPGDRVVRIRDLLSDDDQIYSAEECTGETIIRSGDLLIGMDGDFNIHRWTHGAAKLNQRVCALRAPNANVLDFLYYAVRKPLSLINDLKYATTVKHLSSSEVLKISLALPPEAELKRILLFVNTNVARIDALIAEYERLITLLKEKRQALISHAVTKGLNPDVPMKDSGVEWLGQVPEHWDTVKLRRVAKSVDTGSTPVNNTASEDEITGIPWYTPGDFSEQIALRKSAKALSQQVRHDNDIKLFQSGSVMIVSIGATLGKVGYMTTEGSANQQINIIQPDVSVVARYFLALSLSVKRENMIYLANTSTIGIMNQEKTKEIWLALPPLPEQQAIAAYLDQETTRMDTLIQQAETGIDLLKERRTTLISDAVTGKIDVRELQSGGVSA